VFIDLIYKGNKVFSSAFKRSESITTLLSTIKQKEDLSTAVLLIEEGDDTTALFILENKLYALYCLEADHSRPLLFSDLFKKSCQYEAQVTLYQLSPVLFKCLLVLCQSHPSLIDNPTLTDLEQLLGKIKKQEQEAILVFKENKTIQLFYFLNGNVRDTYPEKQAEKTSSCKLKEQILEAGKQNKGLHIALFDKTDISAANDHDTAEQIILRATPTRDENDTHPPPDLKSPLLDKRQDPQQPSEKVSTEIQENRNQDKKSEEPSTSKKNETFPLWVKVLDGSRAGFLIRFSQEPVSLGRGNVSVRLNDPQVSRFHAELAWGKDGLFIRDNHSTNGIFVNDEPADRKALSLHDIIRLGDVRLKVVAGS